MAATPKSCQCENNAFLMGREHFKVALLHQGGKVGTHIWNCDPLPEEEKRWVHYGQSTHQGEGVEVCGQRKLDLEPCTFILGGLEVKCFREWAPKHTRLPKNSFWGALSGQNNKCGQFSGSQREIYYIFGCFLLQMTLKSD